tara:strand:- start:148 stop:393 length:246 start_codon:yes stop_codon:yes gene_type:complete
MILKTFKLLKIIAILLIAVLILALDKNSNQTNENFVEPLNKVIESNNFKIDFMCYNMCKETTRGLNILELDRFCKKQCPLE